MMDFAAMPPEGARINDIEAINAVITHPEVDGEAGRIVDVEDRLVVTVPGIAVCFRDRGDLLHEAHLAVIPEMRGKATMRFLKTLAAWWWHSQPSDTLITAIPEHKRAARFLMHGAGFKRCKQCIAPCLDGVTRPHVIYKMERPR